MAGEWSVIDLERDYRICAYHASTHGGVHIHHPVAGPAGASLGELDCTAAQELMETYASFANAFNDRFFAEVTEFWRSKSRRS